MKGKMRLDSDTRVLRLNGIFPKELKRFLALKGVDDGRTIEETVIGMIEVFRKRAEKLKSKKGLYKGLKVESDCEMDCLNIRNLPVRLSNFLHEMRVYVEIKDQVAFIVRYFKEKEK